MIHWFSSILCLTGAIQHCLLAPYQLFICLFWCVGHNAECGHFIGLGPTLWLLLLSRLNQDWEWKLKDFKLFPYISLFTSLHLALPLIQCVTPRFTGTDHHQRTFRPQFWGMEMRASMSLHFIGSDSLALYTETQTGFNQWCRDFHAVSKFTRIQIVSCCR